MFATTPMKILTTVFPLILAVSCAAGPDLADSQPSEWALSYDQPAEQWVEALPIGNGRLGGMVFGGPASDRIQFNESTLWTGEPHDYAHSGAVKYLPQLRQLLFEGKQDEAHRLGNQEFMSINTRGTNRQEAYQPFGDLTMTFPGHEHAKDYYRELNIDRAVSLVRYTAEVFREKLPNERVRSISTSETLMMTIVSLLELGFLKADIRRPTESVEASTRYQPGSVNAE